MALKTKSIRSEIAPDDGLRICIMREYNPEKHPEYKSIDEHCTNLAPSMSLLKDWQKRRIKWDEYVSRFTNYNLSRSPWDVRNIARRAMVQNVTLLCYEESPDYCHRRIVALACKMYRPNLKLILE